MFTGSIVALVTPMFADGQIDVSALKALVDWHVEAGTSAIVAVGTTGESPTLSVSEHVDVVRLVVEQAAGRIPVIAGNGANSTREAIELTQALSQLPIAACLCVTPYYNKPTQQGLFLHFQQIAQSSAVPQLLYNVPSRTACDLLPETVARLAQVPNIIGIKEATGNLQRLAQIRELTSSEFILLSGDDASAREFILQGGQGVISVTANLDPVRMAQMCAAALSGDHVQAELLDRPLALLHDKLFVEANPIPVKWALQQLGRIDSGIRLPLTPLSTTAIPAVHQALQAANLL